MYVPFDFSYGFKFLNASTLFIFRFRHNVDPDISSQRFQVGGDLCEHFEKGLEKGVWNCTYSYNCEFICPIILLFR